LAAVAQDDDAIEFADESLQDDHEILLAAGAQLDDDDFG